MLLEILGITKNTSLLYHQLYIVHVGRGPPSYLNWLSQYVSDDAASIDSEFSQPEVCWQVYYSERSITSSVVQTISNQKSD